MTEKKTETETIKIGAANFLVVQNLMKRCTDACEAADQAQKNVEQCKKDLWDGLGELYPQVKGGNWEINDDFQEHGLFFLKKADDEDDLPAPVRAIIKAAERAGAKVLSS